MKIYILMVIAGLLILAGLTIDKLSSDAVALTLGVIFGILAGIPATMLMAVGRQREPEERIVYRVIEKRPVYRVATMEPDTRLIEDDLIDWDCFDAQAQVQLGMTPRQIAERGKP